ncbi:MAG: hypothetical protein CMJ40_11460 [Phycisphaerae bacterium]|nr:hypothetical protein [Phycisphaerae bacterium]|tara:strand:+ start:238 stop:786 length:549 start_codon:yes stop_codon:yes gene_type:complete
MTPLIITRVSVAFLLVAWSFLDYGFVRGSYGAVLPDFWNLVVILLLTLLLMIPSLVFLPLWILPELLRKWKAGIRRSRCCCPECGQALENIGDICLECGPLNDRNGPDDRSLFLSCLTIWLGCWLVGSIAGESIARLDEHQFIQSQEGQSDATLSRERWKPFWGSLHWDEQTATAQATLHEY